MAEKQLVLMDEGLPGAPPLFVTAFSEDGRRHEELLESGQPAPKWFNSAPFVRVQAPNGLVKDGVLSSEEPGGPYEKCLSLLGAKRAWAPAVLDTSAAAKVASLELWTKEEGEVSDGAAAETVEREREGSVCQRRPPVLLRGRAPQRQYDRARSERWKVLSGRSLSR